MTKEKQEKLTWLLDQDKGMSQEDYELLEQCVDDSGYFDSELHNQLQAEIMGQFMILFRCPICNEFSDVESVGDKYNGFYLTPCCRNKIEKLARVHLSDSRVASILNKLKSENIVVEVN